MRTKHTCFKCKTEHDIDQICPVCFGKGTNPHYERLNKAVMEKFDEFWQRELNGDPSEEPKGLL